MNKSFIEKSIEIKTTPKLLWQVFTDPSITRRMGGEYLTDWKVGSNISWKGIDGTVYTYGLILELEPEKILKHSLFNPGEETAVLSVITYQFEDNNGSTTLTGREDYTIEMTDKEYEDAAEGWGFALNILKETAETVQLQSQEASK
jgi:uncharacterized protein YndB with AHSA1/START domain